jgi:FixJ family two-component response regulator
MHGFDAKVFDTVEGLLDGARLNDAACLVLDVDLNGTSGIDVARQLARSGHSLPVIFITGNQSETIHRAALEAGCIAYLRKPFSSNLLIAAIEQIVGENIPAR